MRNIINIIRLKMSNFIRKHKYKIKDLGSKLIIVAMGVFIATIILSVLSNVSKDEKNNDISNVYKPTDTVIKGPDISKEEYEEDFNLVNTFLEHCNNKKIEEAYSLLSDECKQESYPTIEVFKKKYINTIFNRKRECNLQSWISTTNYVVYKVRYANNMLATGTYDENDVYQDYITLKRKNNTEKISIGNFIDSEELNIISKTDEIEATVTKKMQYLSYEEYKINIKNKTDKTILLDNLKYNTTIKLMASSGTPYTADINRLFVKDLVINQNETITVTLRFMKNFSSDNKSKEISILNIIKDYEDYIQKQEEYTDVTNITIKVVN